MPGMLLIFIGVLAGIGAISSFIVHDDNPVEEHIEKVIEGYVEDMFELPEGTLDGKIDLSPFSDESV